jgi:ElaB/YqjD/DUF883 family membrane-anchored ribosome-binding protein
LDLEEFCNMSATAKINLAADAVKDETDEIAATLKRGARQINGADDTVSDRIREVADELSDDVSRWAGIVSSKTKENPLLAIGIAVAAGVFLAKLSRR